MRRRWLVLSCPPSCSTPGGPPTDLPAARSETLRTASGEQHQTSESRPQPLPEVILTLPEVILLTPPEVILLWWAALTTLYWWKTRTREPLPLALVRGPGGAAAVPRWGRCITTQSLPTTVTFTDKKTNTLAKYVTDCNLSGTL